MSSASIASGPVRDTAGVSSSPTESSLIGRFVAILTPVFAIVAGWIAGLIAQAVPGAHLDQNQIVAFMAAAAASAIAAGWKWLQGWQQHEALVARGMAVPVRAGRSAPSVAPRPAAPSVAPRPAAPPVAAGPPAPAAAAAPATGGGAGNAG